MPGKSPIPRHSFGRTFIVAAVLLGVVAAGQLVMVTWAFFHKTPAPPMQIDVSKLRADVPPPPEPEEPLPAADPLDSADAVEITDSGARPVPVRPTSEPPIPPEARPLTSETPPVVQPENGAPGQARPTPVPLSAFTPKADPRVAELIEQGKLLRNSGDTAGALVKFRQAEAMDAGNPTSIAEIAYTFEKMSLPDKAAEQWRRIIAMGEGAGALYSAARAKLDMAVAGTVGRVAPSGPVTISDGKTLALGSLAIRDGGSSAGRKFVLHVPIHAKGGADIAVKDMRVYVHFFEKINGKDIVRTAANVTTRWSEPPVDWHGGGAETLEVTYDLPPNESGGEPREYFGYIVRLYYAGNVEDTRAEPAALLKKFPAPETPSE